MLNYITMVTIPPKNITLFHYLVLACEASCHHVVLIGAFSMQCLLETIVCACDLNLCVGWPTLGSWGTRCTNVVPGVGIAHQGLVHEGVCAKLVHVGWP